MNIPNRPVPREHPTPPKKGRHEAISGSINERDEAVFRCTCGADVLEAEWSPHSNTP